MSNLTKPISNPAVNLRIESDDWAFLYNPDTDDMVGINPIGVMIWKLIDGKKSVVDIANACKEQCSGIPDDIENQINDFLQDLNKHKMLEE